MTLNALVMLWLSSAKELGRLRYPSVLVRQSRRDEMSIENLARQ